MRHGFSFIGFLIISIFAYNCTVINNNINDIAQTCGIAVEELDPEDQYFRFVSVSPSSGENGLNIEARDLHSEESISVSSEGCVAKSSLANFSQILVRNKSSQEGLSLNVEELLAQAKKKKLIHIPLEKHTYRPIPSVCHLPLYSNSEKFEFPLPTNITLSAYDVNFSFMNEKDQRLVHRRTKINEIDLLKVDISSYPEGQYKAYLSLKELYSIAEEEYKLECVLNIDRTPGSISLQISQLNKTLKVDKQDFALFMPGEVIKIHRENSSAEDKIFFCLKAFDDNFPCEYGQLYDSAFIVPASGKWRISLYIEDQSGNKSEVNSINFVAYDQTAINEINSLISLSKEYRNSGKNLEALQKSVYAYFKTNKLSTDIEKEVVTDSVYEAVLSNSFGPFVSYTNKSDGAESRSFLGWADRENFFEHIYIENERYFAVRSIDNVLKFQTSLPKDLIPNYTTKDPSPCKSSSHFVFLFDRDNIVRLDLESPLEHKQINVDGYRLQKFQISFDCQKIIASATKNDTRENTTLIFDFEDSGSPKEIDSDKTWEFVNVNGKGRLVSLDNDSNILSFYDSEENNTIPNVKSITAVSQCGDYFSVLTSDGITQVYNKFNLVLSLATKVSKTIFSESCKTVGFITEGESLYLYSLETGARISEIYRGPAIAYNVSIGDDLIAAILEPNSNEVAIWTIYGVRKESLLSKDVSISQIKLSSNDHLYVSYREGNIISQIFQKGSLLLHRFNSVKGIPNGLKAIEPNRYLYKQLLYHRDKSYPFIVDDSLVYVDLNSGKFREIPLPKIIADNTELLNVGDLSLAHSIETFYDQENLKIATVINRGTVRFYDDITFESYYDYKISEQWLLDISIQKNGKDLIAAGRDGYVYITKGNKIFYFDLKNHHKVAFNDAYTYPIRVSLIDKNDMLIVSDSKGYIHTFNDFSARLALADTINHSRPFESPSSSIKAHNSSTMLAVSPSQDMIASTGLDGNVKIWDLQMNLLKQFKIENVGDYELVSGGVAITFSSDSQSVFVGANDGSWNQFQINEDRQIKVLFGQRYQGAHFVDMMPGPKPRLLTSNGIEAMVWELDLDSYARKACDFLSSRMQFLRGLTDEELSMCEDL